MTTQQATIIQNLTDSVEKEGAHARPEAAASLLTFAEFVAIFEKLDPPPAQPSPVVSEPAPEVVPPSDAPVETAPAAA